MRIEIWLTIFAFMALAGWVCFGVVVWLSAEISKGWQHVHRLQEERHLKESAVIAAMGNQIQLISALNVTMAKELSRRGIQPPTQDEADWWKQDGGSGQPPRN